MIPPLTIQLIVENAIKHELEQKKDEGVVCISTLEIEDYYQIKVMDDGV